MLDQYLPLVLSAVAVATWALAGMGFLEHWRRRWQMPFRALAAAIVAGVSAAAAYLIASGIYLDPEWTRVSRPVANVERAILATTGIVALWELIRSARRQRR